MPVYPFRCDGCNAYHEAFAPIQQGPPSEVTCDCGTRMNREYGVPAVKAAYVEHFNESVGRFVRNDREFKDALKQGAEDTYLRTGYQTNYVPVEVGDILASTDKDEAQQKRMWEEAR